MTELLRERTEHAAKYGANLVVPAREIKQLLEERDQAEDWADKQSYPLIMRQGEILTGVALALNGPPPPLTSWSHHDLAEKAEQLVATLNRARAALAPYLAAGHIARCDGDAVDDCNRCAATAIASALAEGGEQR